jgi:HEPN domain-containing protein
MSDPDVLAQCGEWFRYASNDLAQADRIAHSDFAVPQHICWLAQQAAEKAINACLVFLQIEFPRVHDLARLRHLLPGDWSVREVPGRLDFVSAFAVVARYPGPLGAPTDSDASRALQLATRIVDAARRDLADRGLQIP